MGLMKHGSPDGLTRAGGVQVELEAIAVAKGGPTVVRLRGFVATSGPVSGRYLSGLCAATPSRTHVSAALDNAKKNRLSQEVGLTGNLDEGEFQARRTRVEPHFPGPLVVCGDGHVEQDVWATVRVR